MRRLIPLLLVLLYAAPPAGAGAWMRESGHGFLALSGTFRQGDRDTRRELSAYADLGLSPHLAIGVDINDRPVSTGHALLFARMPLTPPAAHTRLAAEIAIGAHHGPESGAYYEPDVWAPMYRVTLSLGHGFQTRRGAGWYAIDAGYERRFGNTTPTYKLDATLGLSAPGRIHPILQLETAQTPGRPLDWTASPGLLIDTNRDTTWLIGLEGRSAGHGTIGIKLALWHRF